eukprot:2352796-Ditylum_brightwellii.AAC.2
MLSALPFNAGCDCNVAGPIALAAETLNYLHEAHCIILSSFDVRERGAQEDAVNSDMAEVSSALFTAIFGPPMTFIHAELYTTPGGNN